MSIIPQDGSRGRVSRITGRVYVRPSRAMESHGSERFSAAVVAILTCVGAALSMYDLHLLLTRMVR
jgi:hypothetical protein